MKLHVDSLNYFLKMEQSDSSLPYLILLHGFMGTGLNFSHLIEPLSTFCNPITIDLLGHGQSDTCTDPYLYTTGKQVFHIQSILNRLQIRNLHLYGYSMGGRLALQLLHHYPDFFKSAIIESSHCGLKNESDRLERRNNDEILAGEMEQNFESFLNKWTQLPLFDSTPEFFKESYKKVMLTQDSNSMAASLRGFGAGEMPFICTHLKEIKTPIHLIAGELDPKYHLLMQQISAMNLYFTFECIPNAGHRVHTDQPDLLIESIHKFLYEKNS